MKDKSVNHGGSPRPRTRRKKEAWVSDAYAADTFLGHGPVSVAALDGTPKGIGRRLEAIAHALGKDKSVFVTERSWRQLQRYFSGEETPLGVVTLLAGGMYSAEYIVCGNILTADDAEAEISILGRNIDIMEQASSAPAEELQEKRLAGLRTAAMTRLVELQKIHAILLDRPRRLKTAEEFADPSAASLGSIDRDVLDALRDTFGVRKLLPSSHPNQSPPETAEHVENSRVCDNSEAGRMEPSNFPSSAAKPGSKGAEIDAKLMGGITEGIATLYKEENAGLSPRFLGERAAQIHAELMAAYDTPDERLVGLKLALEQLRRELRAPRSAGSSKYSA